MDNRKALLSVFAAIIGMNESSWNEIANAIDSRNDTPQFLYTDKQIRDAYLACRAVYFCQLFLCTLGNGLNLWTLIRSAPTWKTSACHYMIATAIADLVALWSGFYCFLTDIQFGGFADEYTDTYRQDVPSVRYVYKLFLPWFSDASMSLSDWILAVFSWERLLVILSPFRFRFLQRVFTARLIIVPLVILSLACYVYDFAGNYCMYSYTLYEMERNPPWTCSQVITSRSWWPLDRRAHAAVHVLIFLLILIPSVFLIAFLARQRHSEFGKMRRLQKQAGNNAAVSQVSPSPDKSQHGINIILLSSALLYLITRTPKIFDQCALLLPPSVKLSYKDDHGAYALSQPIIVVTTYLGYSLNFYIYLLTEYQYRRRFIELVVRPVCRPCCPTLFTGERTERRAIAGEISPNPTTHTTQL
ncbi:uncharacterized protein LOC129592865 [Paramacrobiotus metropolitanus]|uniref:uncharacterized protein LOC129592865 n=1 Tax=Paramacrobiotus metropolitanus TaxID=2943436 RepID=UPI002445FAFD|nr:uncharacterized protein LOC129592865 [Paramacrobiotus metropolitanus]